MSVGQELGAMVLTTEKMKIFGGPDDAGTNAEMLRKYSENVVDLPQVSEQSRT